LATSLQSLVDELRYRIDDVGVFNQRELARGVPDGSKTTFYFVRYPIKSGSEIVYQDDVEVAAEAFELDYDTGKITFSGSGIPAANAKIEIDDIVLRYSDADLKRIIRQAVTQLSGMWTLSLTVSDTEIAQDLGYEARSALLLMAEIIINSRETANFAATSVEVRDAGGSISTAQRARGYDLRAQMLWAQLEELLVNAGLLRKARVRVGKRIDLGEFEENN